MHLGSPCPAHSGHSRALPRHLESWTHTFPALGPDVDLGPGTPVAAKAFFNGGALSWETKSFLINAKRGEQGSPSSPSPTRPPARKPYLAANP